MTKKLSDYITAIKPHITEQNADFTKEIRNISYNSSEVTKGTLFICKGANFKESFLEEAIQKGATCYISEKKYNVDSDYILVNDLRLVLGKTVQTHFSNLGEKLKLIGITGTKGKSTTSLFLRSILDYHTQQIHENPSGILCSILTYDGKEELPSRLTTKEPIELYTHLQNAVETNTKYVTMEVSSQAVKYHRIYGLDFTLGCYLNIGEDHISPSEHPDFEDYFTSKLNFFQNCKEVCINLDGVCTDRVLNAVPKNTKAYTCSRLDPTADYYVESIEKDGISSNFTVKSPHFTENFSISMAGLFNIDNAVCAIALADRLGIPLPSIKEGLKLGRSPGRMELYESQNKKITILVDYAHNKMSFQSLFSSMKEEFPHKKLIAVFGCPGNKALDRREDMGKIADQFADFSILTEDDPSKEKIEDICTEIASHMIKKQYKIQPDRPQAVKEAMSLFPEEEVLILLLGKGTESDQKRASGYETMPTDADTALKYLSEYNNSPK